MDPQPTFSKTKGIVLILVATLGIVMMNTCAKKGSQDHGPVEMVCFRGMVTLVLLMPYMLFVRGTEVFKTRRIRNHIYRALVGNLGVAFVFWAYALLPMANATALLFSAPLLVAILSPLLLGEAVDKWRWGAVLAGFVGVVLVARPSGDALFDKASLVGFGAACCIALVDIALRDLGRTDDPLTTVFYFIAFGVLFSAPYTFLKGRIPSADMMPWIIAMGIFAAIQQVAKTTAYKFAEASLLAPYTYSAIFWATLMGWLIWDQLPTQIVVTGIIMIVCSNFFVILKEVGNRSRTKQGP